MRCFDGLSVLSIVMEEVVCHLLQQVRNGETATEGEVVFENLIKTFWCEIIIFKNVKI